MNYAVLVMKESLDRQKLAPCDREAILVVEVRGGGAVYRPPAEEMLALDWPDIDFESLSMKVVRAVVHGRVESVKAEYSEEELPLDSDFACVLLEDAVPEEGPI